MTTPAAEALRVLWGMAFGAALGVWWDLLKPLSGRHPHLCDLLFVPALLWAWLEHGFGVCRGDLRLGYTAALGVGWILWEMTLGRLLTGAVTAIWNFLAGLFRALAGYFGKKFKIFSVFSKKYLHIRKNGLQ